MKIDGQCYCGALVFEAELDKSKIGICHCADCQSLSASAFRTIAIVAGEKFKVIKGTPKKYVKVSESGNRRVQAFCGDCGSGLYACDDSDNPAVVNVRVGTVRQRAELAPVFECWKDSALSWLPELEGSRKHSRNPKF